MGLNGLVGAVVVVAVLLACTAFARYRRARDGRLAGADSGPRREAAAHREVLAGLGVRSGDRLTLLQFSAEFCAPCRATRALCEQVAATVEGVRHVEVDAEKHLDAVRALDIRRTPTLLLIDPSGRVLRRGSGAPTRTHLLTVVHEALEAVA